MRAGPFTDDELDEPAAPSALNARRDRRHQGSARPPLFVLLALVLMGAGMTVLGAGMSSRPTEVIGVNRPVNAGASDPTDITAHNSPSLSTNPTDGNNLVVANRIDSPGFSCALHVSEDAGGTWAETEVPFPAGEELPARCFAPDVGFGPEGTLYLSYVTLAGAGNRPNALWVVTSRDGGRTLSAPTRVAGPLAFQVRLAVDPVRPGRLWLSWLQAETTGNLAFPQPGNPVVMAGSVDAGMTWGAPVTVSAPARQRVVAPSAAVGSNGQLAVLYLDLMEDSLDYHGAHGGQGGPAYPGPWSLVLARSGDAGASWTETVVDPSVVPTERFVVFIPPSPSLALDRQADRVYVAFQDGRWGDADVAVWTSDDGGATFAAPVRINDTAFDDGTRQYLPKLAVAPGGRLDVVYYDRRIDLEDVFNEVSLQSSSDGGRTFSPRLRVSDRPFDSRIGSGIERDLPDLGSRLGLVSFEDRVHAVWTDTRGGNEVSLKQDLAMATVGISPGAPWRWPLLVGGPILIGIGLLGGLRRIFGFRVRARDGPGEVACD